MAERISTNTLADEPEVIGARRRWLVALRLIVIIAGGYAAASALVAGIARVLPVTGLARSEAVALTSMCGFLFYLALLVWGFSRPRLATLVLGLSLAGGVGVVFMLAAGN